MRCHHRVQSAVSGRKSFYLGATLKPISIAISRANSTATAGVLGAAAVQTISSWHGRQKTPAMHLAVLGSASADTRSGRTCTHARVMAINRRLPTW